MGYSIEHVVSGSNYIFLVLSFCVTTLLILLCAGNKKEKGKTVEEISYRVTNEDVEVKLEIEEQVQSSATLPNNLDEPSSDKSEKEHIASSETIENETTSKSKDAVYDKVKNGSRLKDPIYDKVKEGSGNTESSGNSTRSDGIYSSVKPAPKEETAYLVVNLTEPNENYEVVADKIVRKTTDPQAASESEEKSFYENVETENVDLEEDVSPQDSTDSLLYEKVPTGHKRTILDESDVTLPTGSCEQIADSDQLSNEQVESTYDTANHTQVNQPFLTEIESSGPYATVGSTSKTNTHKEVPDPLEPVVSDPGKYSLPSNETDASPNDPNDVYESVQETLLPVTENTADKKPVEIDKKKHRKNSKKEKQPKHSHGITNIFNKRKSKKTKENDHAVVEVDIPTSSVPLQGRSDHSPSFDMQRKTTRTSSSGNSTEEPPPPPSIDRLKNLADQEFRKHGRKPSGDVFNLHMDNAISPKGSPTALNQFSDDFYTNKGNSLERPTSEKRNSRLFENPPSPAFSSEKSSLRNGSVCGRNQSPLPDHTGTGMKTRAPLPKRKSHENMPLPPVPIDDTEDTNFYESIGGSTKYKVDELLKNEISKQNSDVPDSDNKTPEIQRSACISPENRNSILIESQSMSKTGSSSSLNSAGVKIIASVKAPPSASPSPEHKENSAEHLKTCDHVALKDEVDANAFEVYAAVDFDKKKQERLVKDMYAVVGPKSRTGTVVSSDEGVESSLLYEDAYTLIPETTLQACDEDSSTTVENCYEPIKDVKAVHDTIQPENTVSNDCETIQDDGYEAVGNILSEEELRDMKNQRKPSQTPNDFVLQEQRRLTLERNELNNQNPQDADEDDDYVELK